MRGEKAVWEGGSWTVLHSPCLYTHLERDSQSCPHNPTDNQSENHTETSLPLVKTHGSKLLVFAYIDGTCMYTIL